MFTLAYTIKNSSDIPDVPLSGEHTDWLEVSGAGVAEANGLYQKMKKLVFLKHIWI